MSDLVSLSLCKIHLLNKQSKLWLVWLSGLSAGLRTKGSLVRFPLRAHAWVVGQVSHSWVLRRQPHIDVCLPLCLPPFPSLKINKQNFKKIKNEKHNSIYFAGVLQELVELMAIQYSEECLAHKCHVSVYCYCYNYYHYFYMGIIHVIHNLC